MAAATAQQVLTAALALMHESTQSDYESRALPLVNAVLGECWQYSLDHSPDDHDGWTPVTALSGELTGIDNTLAYSVMPFGLAALLYLDEDAPRADSWYNLYEERLAECRRNRRAAFQPIVSVY